MKSKVQVYYEKVKMRDSNTGKSQYHNSTIVILKIKTEYIICVIYEHMTGN